MGSDQLDYNRRRASDQYSHAVDEWLHVEYSHFQEVLAWERRVENLKSMVFSAVDAEAQNRKSSTNFAARLAGEDIRHSRITDARARVVASKHGVGTGVEGIVIRLRDMMNNLQLAFTALIRDGPRVAIQDPINLAVADFTTASIDTSAAAGAASVAAVKVFLLLGSMIMDLDVVFFGPVLPPAEAGEVGAVAKAVADLIGDVHTFHLSASNAITVPSPVGNDEDIPLAAGQHPPLCGVASRAYIASSGVPSAVLSEAKSAGGTRFTLLTNQPSAAVASNWTAESISPPKSDFGGVKHSSSRKKLGV